MTVVLILQLLGGLQEIHVKRLVEHITYGNVFSITIIVVSGGGGSGGHGDGREQ